MVNIAVWKQRERKQYESDYSRPKSLTNGSTSKIVRLYTRNNYTACVDGGRQTQTKWRISNSFGIKSWVAGGNKSAVGAAGCVFRLWWVAMKIY